MLGNSLPQLVLIVFLTLLNAFFAAAEMAIISVNKNRIRQLSEAGNKRARLLEKLLIDPSNFLSTIQVGITLGGFLSSASAATGLADDLSIYLNHLNIPYSTELAVILITVILSFMTLIFGELVPKQIALKQPESIALLSVRPIRFISRIAKPFIKLLSFTSKIILKLLGYGTEGEVDQISEREIIQVLESSYEQGVISENVLIMVPKVFAFHKTPAYEMMTPRPLVFMIDINKPIHKSIQEIIRNKYTRIPVYEHNIDNIVGILYLKDLLTEANDKGFSQINLRKIIRKPYLIKETKSIDKLYRELQDHQVHMAVLIDEFGGFSGIITIEDMIETIMGKIIDEYGH